MKYTPKDPDIIWAEFKGTEGFSDEQVEQFKLYETYLSGQNELFNLTAVQGLTNIVRNHFQDSLMLRKFVDMNAVTSICDIGAGAGFPALPLKIAFPHLKVVLIEVTRKKREFLRDLCDQLGLTDVEITGDDWRTFVRTTKFSIDLFVTRAALEDLELIRMFKPASPYRNAQLVYWASELWQAHQRAAGFVKRIESYRLNSKSRRFIFMGL
jgi:16S rRNA (guanine(527)-N(7))-methyltransferase RsmG